MVQCECNRMKTQILCGICFGLIFFPPFLDSSNLTQHVFSQNTGTKENVKIVPLHLSTILCQNVVLASSVCGSKI